MLFSRIKSSEYYCWEKDYNFGAILFFKTYLYLWYIYLNQRYCWPCKNYNFIRKVTFSFIDSSHKTKSNLQTSFSKHTFLWEKHFNIFINISKENYFLRITWCVFHKNKKINNIYKYFFIIKILIYLFNLV